MTEPSTQSERSVEIDLGKIIPLGLIPLVILAIVLIATNQNNNRAVNRLTASVDSARGEVKGVKEQVDTLTAQNKAILRVLCNRNPAKDINLTGLRCP